MNMKQKLTYMLIGCLFTLAGFVLSSLFNTPPHVQAQDEKVIDEIVCKNLKIVNDDGKILVRIGSLLGKYGFMSIKNVDRKPLVSIRSSLDGKSGAMGIFNADGKKLVDIGAVVSGAMEIYNADGKPLVGIGSEKGRPNDGLINIYNHKGEWRSYKVD